MRLNIIFHDIVKSENDLKNEFSITIEYYLSLVSKIEEFIIKKQAKFNEVCFYFDDGYRSFKDLIFPSIKDDYYKYCLAIVTNSIGQEGYLSASDLILFRDRGISITSHGCSHVALAIYDRDKLQSTASGGFYKDSTRGKSQSLMENQVLYQLVESKKILVDVLKQEINEFVFPYGLYSNDTLKINNKNKAYSYLAICDNEYLDDGKNLRSRFLVTNKLSVQQTFDLILQLKIKE
ncbi:MAG: polysaccharide deacetylase family protein [bacterium]